MEGSCLLTSSASSSSSIVTAGSSSNVPADSSSNSITGACNTPAGSSNVPAGSSKADYIVKFEEACLRHPDLLNFDCTPQDRMRIAMRTLGILMIDEPFSLELDGEADSNPDNAKVAVKDILELKEDVWKNPKLFFLVRMHLNNNVDCLDFCAKMASWVVHASEVKLSIQANLRSFEVKKNYRIILEMIREYKGTDDFFVQEFYQSFEIIYDNVIATSHSVKLQNQKFNNKLKRIKKNKKWSIFFIILGGVWVALVVAYSKDSTLMTIVKSILSMIPFLGVWKLVNSCFMKSINKIQELIKVNATMHAGTMTSILKLHDIRSFVSCINTLFQSDNFFFTDTIDVKIRINEIKFKFEKFIENVDELEKMINSFKEKTKAVKLVALRDIVMKDK